MDSNKFNSGFNTIADQFRNKGVASNKQRMAGDYLAEFTKDSGVQSVLGNKDYRNGVSNSKDGDKNEPSAVMSTLGAKPTPAPGAPVSKAKAASTPSAASSSETAGYNGLPSVQQRVEKYYNSLKGDSKANFKTLDRGGGSTNETFYQDVYQQDEDLIKWADSYTGPKTWSEVEAAEKNNTGDVKSRNTTSIANYNNYTKYTKAMETKKSIMDNWNKK